MKKKLFWVLGLLVILVLFVTWWFIYESNFWSKHQCRESIKEKLKSPSTAKFSNYREIWFDVYAYDVDSQNWFWAIVRSKFTCHKTNWNIVSVEATWLSDHEIWEALYENKKEEISKMM